VQATLPFGTVAVIGLGLMGGSLARALRTLTPAPQVIGFSSSERDLDDAMEAGVLDRPARNAEDAAASADLVVYATPLGATLELLSRHTAVWRTGAVVSDLASLKAPVLEQVRAVGAEARWVGAHPMTGGEGSGYGASSDTLYRGAPVWLCGRDASPDARSRVASLWSLLGASPAWTTEREHDARMVGASHLPQILANALAGWMARAGLTPTDLGPGGRDMTRLAASSPDMWDDLFTHSAPALSPALRDLARALAVLADHLDSTDVAAISRLMEETRQWHADAPLWTKGQTAMEADA